MALRILDTGSHADTWADFARRRDSSWQEHETPVFAKSHAYSLLIRELNRYLQHQIRGRSFLISGHRGSGKTSLVLRAVQDLQNRQTGDLLQRPLLVKLHGPSLLSPLKQPNNNENGDDDGSEKEDDVDSPALSVLVEITIALYRSLCGEVARCYRDLIFTKGELGNEENLKELAGQLSLELDNAPEPALLREFWERVDALRSGVLWSQQASSQPYEKEQSRFHWLTPGDIFHKTYPEQVTDQGIRELVAISTAAQAFQVVSGSISYKTVQKDNAQQEESLTTEVKPQVKEILNSLFGLFTGVLVGGAAFIKEERSLLISTGLGLLTAIATGITLTWSTTRKRSKIMSREHSFIRKRTVANLDRELPIVIERIRAAGLAPVFVVDELDKVDNLVESMEHLVQRLKHLVADYSFFCFLTDRDYFEYLHDLSQHTAYPKEHTYFSHRLFVLYQPDDLHTYLDQLINVESGGSRDETGKFALSYLLLHRAMLHTFDLQRELARVCDDEGNVIISTGELRTDLGYRYQIMIQLAIEILLGEPELRHRLNEDPQFGQVAYDALYMPSRNWLTGESELDLTDESIERYLHDRLSHEELGVANQNTRHPEKPVTSDTTPQPSTLADSPTGQHDHDDESSKTNGNKQKSLLTGLVRETDQLYLIGIVRHLAKMLAEPRLIVERLTEDGINDERLAALIDSIPVAENTEEATVPPDQQVSQRSPLIRKVNEEGTRYRWCKDPYGRDLYMEGRLDELIDIEGQLSDQEFIDNVVKSIEKLSDKGLSPDRLAEMGVLKRSPDWEQIKLAGDRLAAFRQDEQIYDELLPHQRSLHEYAVMLARRGTILAKSIIAGLKIGMEAELTTVELQISKGIEALSKILELHRLEFETVEKRVSEFTTQHIGEELSITPLTRDTVSDWSDTLFNLIEKVKGETTKPITDHRALAWENVFTRIESYLVEDIAQHELSINEAACLAADVYPPFSLMKQVDQILIADISHIIYESLNDLSSNNNKYVPLWVGLPLYYLLGLPLLSKIWSDIILWLTSKHFSLREVVKEEIDRASEDSWTRLVEHYQNKPIRQSALIITKGEQGEASKWKISGEYGGVAISYNELTSDRFSSLPQLDIEGALRESGVTLIFVEPAEELTEQAQHALNQLLDRLSSTPVFYLKRSPFKGKMFDWRVINKTESLDAAMDEAIENMQTYMTNAPP